MQLGWGAGAGVVARSVNHPGLSTALRWTKPPVEWGETTPSAWLRIRTGVKARRGRWTSHLHQYLRLETQTKEKGTHSAQTTPDREGSRRSAADRNGNRKRGMMAVTKASCFERDCPSQVNGKRAQENGAVSREWLATPEDEDRRERAKRRRVGVELKSCDKLG